MSKNSLREALITTISAIFQPEKILKSGRATINMSTPRYLDEESMAKTTQNIVTYFFDNCQIPEEVSPEDCFDCMTALMQTNFEFASMVVKYGMSMLLTIIADVITDAEKLEEERKE